MKYLLSTIDPNAHITAQKHGLSWKLRNTAPPGT